MTFLEMEICVRNLRDHLFEWGFGNEEQVKIAVLKFLKYQREVVARESSSDSSSERFPERHRAFLLSCSYDLPRMKEVVKGVQLDHYERRQFREDMSVLMKKYIFSKEGGEVRFNKMPSELRKLRREQRDSNNTNAVEPVFLLMPRKQERQPAAGVFSYNGTNQGTAPLQDEVNSLASDSADQQEAEQNGNVCVDITESA